MPRSTCTHRCRVFSSAIRRDSPDALVCACDSQQGIYDQFTSGLLYAVDVTPTANVIALLDSVRVQQRNGYTGLLCNYRMTPCCPIFVLPLCSWLQGMSRLYMRT